MVDCGPCSHLHLHLYCLLRRNNDDDDSSGGGGSGGDDDDSSGSNGDDDSEEAAGEGDEEAGGEEAEGDDNAGNGGNAEAAGNDDNTDDQNGNGNDGRNSGNGADDDMYGDDGYEVNNQDVAENGNENGENPMESFDISDCSTYGNLWVWDLALSCDSDASLENCECTFTDQLMDAEMISCNDIKDCPVECPVCETCFQLAGCTPVRPNTVFVGGGKSTTTYLAIAAAVAIFLFGVGYYYYQRRKNENDSELGTGLIDKQLQDTVGKIPPADPDRPGYDPELAVAGNVPDNNSDASSVASMSQTSQVSISESEVELSPTRTGPTDPDGATAEPSGHPALPPLPEGSREAVAAAILENALSSSYGNKSKNDDAATDPPGQDMPSNDDSLVDDSASPWIGDIDMSFSEPSMDEDDEDEKDATDALLERLDTSPTDPPVIETAPTDEFFDKKDETASKDEVPGSTSETTMKNNDSDSKSDLTPMEPTTHEATSKDDVPSSKSETTPKDEFSNCKSEPILTEGKTKDDYDTMPAPAPSDSTASNNNMADENNINIDCSKPAAVPKTIQATEKSMPLDEEQPIAEASTVWLAPADGAEEEKTEVIPPDEDISGEVWLAPLTSVEEEVAAAEAVRPMSTQPEEEVLDDKTKDVWLAPSADPDELKPIPPDEGSPMSVSERISTWSDDKEDEGPWLAPIFDDNSDEPKTS